MTERNGKNKIPKEVNDIFTNYFKEIEERRANFRDKLEDKYCKKIFDKLISEAPYKKQVVCPKFRYNEIYNLVKTEMTKPTLDLHLKHLEQKGFIKKKSLTRYKTSYQVNVKTEPKAVQIRKTISGKQELKLVDMSELKKGEVYLQPNLTLKPASEFPPKERRLFSED